MSEPVPGWLRPLVEAVRSTTAADFLRIGAPPPPPDGGRRSAVLILFGPGPDLLLIERSDRLRKHAGQPAFPGGAVDPERRGAGVRPRCASRPRRSASTRPASRWSRCCPSCSCRRPDTWSRRCWPGGTRRAGRRGRRRRGRRGSNGCRSRSWPTRPTGAGSAVRPAMRDRRSPCAASMVWGFTAAVLDRLLELGGWARRGTRTMSATSRSGSSTWPCAECHLDTRPPPAAARNCPSSRSQQRADRRKAMTGPPPRRSFPPTTTALRADPIRPTQLVRRSGYPAAGAGPVRRAWRARLMRPDSGRGGAAHCPGGRTGTGCTVCAVGAGAVRVTVGCALVLVLAACGQPETRPGASPPTERRHADPGPGRHPVRRGRRGRRLPLPPLGDQRRAGAGAADAQERRQGRPAHLAGPATARCERAADHGRAEQQCRFTIGRPGDYRFFCSIHEAQGQVGRLVVASPSEPARPRPDRRDDHVRYQAASGRASSPRPCPSSASSAGAVIGAQLADPVAARLRQDSSWRIAVAVAVVLGSPCSARCSRCPSATSCGRG